MRREPAEKNRSFYGSGGWYIRSAEGNRASTRIFNGKLVDRTTSDVLKDLEKLREQLDRSRDQPAN